MPYKRLDEHLWNVDSSSRVTWIIEKSLCDSRTFCFISLLRRQNSEGHVSCSLHARQKWVIFLKTTHAAVVKFSTEAWHRAVALQQLSLLLHFQCVIDGQTDEQKAHSTVVPRIAVRAIKTRQTFIAPMVRYNRPVKTFIHHSVDAVKYRTAPLQWRDPTHTGCFDVRCPTFARDASCDRNGWIPTGWAKKMRPQSHVHNSVNMNRFTIFFAGRFLGKFAVS